ncbi:MAG: quinate 5-dehydrogenase [Halanaerobiales bacterium]
MKKVLSISLGSSARDHKVHTKILGEEFIIERRGTDGDKEKAYKLFTELDGQYDAFGMGGIDLYIYSGGKRYTFRDAKKLIKNVKNTPTVDGSGLKNTLERMVINYLDNNLKINLASKKVLMVSAVDRFGMAESFAERCGEIIYGDLIFALGLPLKLKSLKTLNRAARMIAPIITKLPFEWVYPTGDKQEKNNAKSKYYRFYDEADIIAGDYHFIKKYMPLRLDEKIIVTNTVTSDNVKEMQTRGVKMIITTTPELNGRSFGTNVMEGVLVALSDKDFDELSVNDYKRLLNKMNFVPRVITFDKKVAS